MNRGVRRLRLFDTPDEYQLAVATLADAQGRIPLRVLAYCVMPNHFHLVVRPTEDGELAKFMQVFSGTHSRRWHLLRGSTGNGAVYQGRYRAFPVQTDDHFLRVCRYVERNPLRAGLVTRAEDWPWSSLADRGRKWQVVRLDPWPVLPPPAEQWLAIVNAEEPSGDITALRTAARLSRPFGAPVWCEQVESQFSQVDRRPAGRPRKFSPAAS